MRYRIYAETISIKIKHKETKTMLIKRILAILASTAFILGSFIQFSPVSAATVTTPATASISSDSFSGSSVSLPALVITETAPGDIPAGVLTWSLPSGYMVDTASVANVVYTGTGLAGSSTVAFVGTTGFSVTVTASSTVAGSLTVGSITPLKVKASSGSSMAASGNIMLSSGSIAGLASTTGYGLLTQVPGLASKLAFTVQPPSSATVAAGFSATVGVQDQFGNLVATDNGRNVLLSANLLASTTSGSLSGVLSHTDALGLAVFGGLSFNMVNQISLTASSTGLSSATGNIVNITAASTTPPSVCGLRNGILVKVAGSPTVYMVVNCVLRPFNTPALFHARGKKFTDIVVINGQLFASLGKGKDIGNSSDDDSTVITPPAGFTPPSISGLPNGSIVKLPGNPTVYIVSGGVLQPFTSPAVFKAHNKDFKNVQIISAAQFASFTVGDPVNFPNGTLVKGFNNTVFVVVNGQLLGIPSMAVLNKHGWSLKNLLKVGDNDLKDLKHGGTQD